MSCKPQKLRGVLRGSAPLRGVLVPAVLRGRLVRVVVRGVC